MFITDWIRALVEGDTADGRNITALEITQMAASYNPETYLAKIWLEHLRGTLPDSVLKPLGNVAETKAEVIKGGDLDGKLALYVKLEPTPELIALVRNGQKTHLSAEIHPAFPTTGGAYLMGVGVTDSPASLGTGIMKFSTISRPENLFSDPLACELGNCADTNDLQAIRAMLEKLTANPQPDPWKGQVQPNPNNPPHHFAAQSDFDQLKQDFVKLKAEWEKYMSEDVSVNRKELGSYSSSDHHTNSAGY